MVQREPEVPSNASTTPLSSAMAEVTVRKFSYESVRLSEKEIRIFTLLPETSNNPEEPIRVNLVKRKVSELPDFYALSYHWGHPDSALQEPQDILANNLRLSITRSLETALRALRPTHGGRQVWADQICINQADKEEKMSQIPYMSQIYSNSVQTIAWLDKKIPTLTATLETLEELGLKATQLGISQLDPKQFRQLYTDEKDDSGGSNYVGDESSARRHKLVEIIDHMGDILSLPGFDGIRKLCEAEYFVRGWIREEIALPEKLLLKWHDGSIDGDTFSAAINLLELYAHHCGGMIRNDPRKTENDLIEFEKKTWAIHDPVHPSLAVRRQYRLDRNARFFNLAFILRKFRHLEFTNPEDRVIGVLALVNDLEKLGLTVQQFKSKSWIDVFTLTAKAIIQKNVEDDDWLGGVNFMSLCGLPLEPRITQADPQSMLEDSKQRLKQARQTLKDATLPPEDCIKTLENATSTLEKVELILEDTWSRLEKATSAFLDIRSKSFSSLLPSWVPNLDDSQITHRTVMTLSEETALFSSRPFHASRGFRHSITMNEQHSVDRETLLCKVVTVDSVKKVGRSKSDFQSLQNIRAFALESAEMVRSDRDSVHPYRGEQQKLLTAIWRVPILDHEFLSNPTATRRATDFSRDGWKAWAQPAARATITEAKLKRDNYDEGLRPQRSRASFLGAKGFVGIGPTSMRQGDLVCVIEGAMFPFILREKDPAESVYTLVGEAYCDGIMDGEAFHMGLASQTFKLR